LLKDRKIIAIPSTSLTKVKRLVVIDSPITLPPNYRNIGYEKILDYNINIDFYNKYRSILLNSIEIQSSNIKYIFLARKQEKRKYNQDEVFKSIESYGFKMVYLEDYSLVEQANLFRNAIVIVGPTGAAWANIIFSNPCQVGVIFQPNTQKTSTVYSNLSAMSKMNLYHIYYEIKVSNWVEYMKSDEISLIDTSKVVEIIRGIFIDK